MIPVQQKYIFKQGKQHGDCWRASLASILECDIELFPDPNVVDNWPELYTQTLEKLEQMGYSYESIPISKFKELNDYVVAIGKSPRSKRKRITHAVVWKGGIVHDPHPDHTGLMDITRFEVIRKIKLREI